VQKPHNLLCLLILGVLSNAASAALLDFNNGPNNLGVTLGGHLMKWYDDTGPGPDATPEGHLYADFSNDVDYIFFSAPTYVNSFKMNAMAWEGSGNGNIGRIDIAGLNAAGEEVWSRKWIDESTDYSVDLTNYTDWDNWLTVDVDTAGITQLTFFAPGLQPHLNAFWPSIDDMVINEVPLPASIWLFASGLMGLFSLRRPRRSGN